MDKIMINGEDWVRLYDICDILRNVEESAKYFKNADKIVNQIARLMFFDEINAVKTKKEKDAACELPGDFVVCQKLDHINPNGKQMIFFMEFKDGEGLATDCGDDAMVFEYKSMAEQVAKKLKGDWRVICIGVEYGRMTRRMLGRIFGDAEIEEEDEDEDE